MVLRKYYTKALIILRRQSYSKNLSRRAAGAAASRRAVGAATIMVALRREAGAVVSGCRWPRAVMSGQPP
jgi:hypothetical protein